MLIGIACGKLRIVGMTRYLQALLRGRVLITPNHPALLESLILSVACYALFPFFAPSVWPYAMPDRKTFLPHWLLRLPIGDLLYRLVRCIPVDRTDTLQAVRGLRQALRKLSEGEVVVVHLEGGRTFKLPEGETHYHGAHSRLLRPLSDGTLLFLRAHDVAILPVWVEYHGGAVTSPLNFRDIWRRGVTITMGTLVDPSILGPRPRDKKLAHAWGLRAKDWLAHTILRTGL
jgi:1-acyl-sn-glycerol-3-phosphate acyltransferase